MNTCLRTFPLPSEFRTNLAPAGGQAGSFGFDVAVAIDFLACSAAPCVSMYARTVSSVTPPAQQQNMPSAKTTAWHNKTQPDVCKSVSCSACAGGLEIVNQHQYL